MIHLQDIVLNHVSLVLFRHHVLSDHWCFGCRTANITWPGLVCNWNASFTNSTLFHFPLSEAWKYFLASTSGQQLNTVLLQDRQLQEARGSGTSGVVASWQTGKLWYSRQATEHTVKYIRPATICFAGLDHSHVWRQAVKSLGDID